MSDIIPHISVVLTFIIISMIFGFFIKPVIDNQTKSGCGIGSYAGVFGNEIERWCEENNK